VVAARRLKVLRNICERVMLAPTIKAFGHTLLEVLSDVQYEGPFAALYRCTAMSDHNKAGFTSEDSESSLSPSRGHGPLNFRINLIGSLGIPEQDDGISHPMFPRSFSAKMTIGHAIRSGEHSPPPEQPLALAPDLHSSRSTPSSDTDSQTICGDDSHSDFSRRSFDWAPLITKAMRMGCSVHTPNLPPDLMEKVGRERGWKDRVREAVVIPIVSEDDDAETAVLILGINTRRPYNEIYLNWIDVMRMTLGSALHAVLGREAETRRADQLARLDAAKTAFFSNASHELRTPLTLIDGPLNEALAMVDDGHVKEQLALAARNTARLSRLVDSLLDFSRASDVTSLTPLRRLT
jgi:GAF domain-containing protein